MEGRNARVALGLVVLGIASCGITARSDEYRCDGPADCADGRQCVDGWCVTGQGDGAPVADGPLSTDEEADAIGCPAACDHCDGDTCVIDCEGDGACSDLVVCPAGLSCEVHCDGLGACESGIDCSGATECNIHCRDTSSCGGPITCGAGRCDVECDGTASCAGGIDCSNACRCETDCDGIGSCAIEPTCPFADCQNGIDCTDNGLACHDCT